MQSDVTVERADGSTEASLFDATCLVYDFLQGLRAEGAAPEEAAPFNERKAVLGVHEAIRDGVVFLAYADGQLVGCLGLVRGSYWYSDAELYADRFLYIRPEYRDGAAWAALLSATRDLANATGCTAKITAANLNKRSRPSRNGIERVGSSLFYFPRGSTYAVRPAKDAA